VRSVGFAGGRTGFSAGSGLSGSGGGNLRCKMRKFVAGLVGLDSRGGLPPEVLLLLPGGGLTTTARMKVMPRGV
jgi:hypothetical protein